MLHVITVTVNCSAILAGMEKHQLCFLLIVGFIKKADCLSRVIFSVLANRFITTWKLHDIGCHAGSVFSCILYADVIISVITWSTKDD